MPSRSTILIVVGVLVAVAFVVLTSGGPQRAVPLDPTNPQPDGAKAVAQVLGDSGVDVEIVRDADAFDDVFADRSALDTTAVVVTGADDLGQSTADAVVARAVDVPTVVVDADFATELFDVLGQPVPQGVDGAVDARCEVGILADLELDVDGLLTYPRDRGCFPVGDRDALVFGTGKLVFFGAGDALTNDSITDGDNAAIALRLLGQRDRLVWYTPDPADVSATDAVGLTTLIPDATLPLLFLLGLCGIALIVWRARRLGPLAREPLPVSIKAIETTRSRGRLYRRAGDRAHAAAALRRATRDAAIARLHLPRSASPDAVISEVARAVGRPEAEVAALLSPEAPPPHDDRALVALAGAVKALEEEVRNS